MSEANSLLRVAAIQMNASLNKQDNLHRAGELVAQAAREGSRLIVLPELFNLYGDLARVASEAEPIDGKTFSLMQRWAKDHQIWLVGSLACRLADGAKPVNLAVALDPGGNLLAQYAKIHLFDIDLPGKVTSRESDHLSSGLDTALATVDWAKAGLAICYDLRFPELFRRYAYAKAELLIVPSAFTRTTGRDHWEVLVRTRAIENQAFVIAANQVGPHQPTGASFGHSLIVDPWGSVLAEGNSEHEAVIAATLDRRRLDEVRLHLPALEHTRLTSS